MFSRAHITLAVIVIIVAVLVRVAIATPQTKDYALKLWS